MDYLDTSAIVKLYVREEYSRDVSNWLRKRNEAIPLTAFHRLELTNAIRLKQQRNEMGSEEAESILRRVEDHESAGIFYHPRVNWNEILILAVELSREHTESTRARSLDIMHVASALSLKADGFLTFDERQARLARARGLMVRDCTGR